MNDGQQVISRFITVEGFEYIKIQYRFFYYVEVLTDTIISEVQDITGMYQSLLDHYAINKKAFRMQKLYSPIDRKIIQEISEIKAEIAGTGWWSNIANQQNGG